MKRRHASGIGSVIQYDTQTPLPQNFFGYVSEHFQQTKKFFFFSEKFFGTSYWTCSLFRVQKIFTNFFFFGNVLKCIPNKFEGMFTFGGGGVSAYRFGKNIQYPVTIPIASCGEIFNLRELARTVRLFPTEY